MMKTILADYRGTDVAELGQIAEKAERRNDGKTGKQEFGCGIMRLCRSVWF